MMRKFWLRVVVSLTAIEMANSINDSEEDGTFNYFAYGSNLLESRMRINCPSAIYLAKVRLKGWRLDFNLFVPRWNGGVANIVKDENSSIWGAVWRIADEEMAKLDEQEGVQLGWYYPKYVTVEAYWANNFVPVSARAYVEVDPPPTYMPPEQLPADRQPSRTYFQVILFGAIERTLPTAYLDYLQQFPNNGMKATNKTLQSLGYPFWDEHNITNLPFDRPYLAF